MISNPHGCEDGPLLATVSEEQTYFEYGLSPSAGKHRPSGAKPVLEQPTTPLSEEEFANLFRELKENVKSQENLVASLDERIKPYLLRSGQLMKLLTLSTSKKSKLALINILVPRLVDPKSQAEYFRGLFTFTTDQQIVDVLIRNRIDEIKLSRYASSSPKRAGTAASSTTVIAIQNRSGSAAASGSAASRRPPPVKPIATSSSDGGSNVSSPTMSSTGSTSNVLNSPDFMSPLHRASRPSPTLTPMLVNPMRGKRVSYVTKMLHEWGQMCKKEALSSRIDRIIDDVWHRESFGNLDLSECILNDLDVRHLLKLMAQRPVVSVLNISHAANTLSNNSLERLRTFLRAQVELCKDIAVRAASGLGIVFLEAVVLPPCLTTLTAAAADEEEEEEKKEKESDINVSLRTDLLLNIATLCGTLKAENGRLSFTSSSSSRFSFSMAPGSTKTSTPRQTCSVDSPVMVDSSNVDVGCKDNDYDTNKNNVSQISVDGEHEQSHSSAAASYGLTVEDEKSYKAYVLHIADWSDDYDEVETTMKGGQAAIPQDKEIIRFGSTKETGVRLNFEENKGSDPNADIAAVGAIIDDSKNEVEVVALSPSSCVVVPPVSKWIKMQVLQLPYKQLQSIEFADYLDPQQYDALQVLILRGNKFSNIKDLRLGDMFKKLTDLDLAHNTLKGTIAIDGESGSNTFNLPDLSLLRLDLGHNLLVGISGLIACGSLLSLNVAHNLIKVIPVLPSTLTDIDISHNLIESTNSLRMLALCSDLRRLKIAGNPLVKTLKTWKNLLRSMCSHLVEIDGKALPGTAVSRAGANCSPLSPPFNKPSLAATVDSGPLTEQEQLVGDSDEYDDNHPSQGRDDNNQNVVGVAPTVISSGRQRKKDMSLSYSYKEHWALIERARIKYYADLGIVLPETDLQGVTGKVLTDESLGTKTVSSNSLLLRGWRGKPKSGFKRPIFGMKAVYPPPIVGETNRFLSGLVQSPLLEHSVSFAATANKSGKFTPSQSGKASTFPTPSASVIESRSRKGIKNSSVDRLSKPRGVNMYHVQKIVQKPVQYLKGMQLGLDTRNVPTSSSTTRDWRSSGASASSSSSSSACQRTKLTASGGGECDDERDIDNSTSSSDESYEFVEDSERSSSNSFNKRALASPSSSPSLFGTHSAMFKANPRAAVNGGKLMSPPTRMFQKLSCEEHSASTTIKRKHYPLKRSNMDRSAIGTPSSVEVDKKKSREERILECLVIGSPVTFARERRRESQSTAITRGKGRQIADRKHGSVSYSGVYGKGDGPCRLWGEYEIEDEDEYNNAGFSSPFAKEGIQDSLLGPSTVKKLDYSEEEGDDLNDPMLTGLLDDEDEKNEVASSAYGDSGIYSLNASTDDFIEEQLQNLNQWLQNSLLELYSSSSIAVRLISLSGSVLLAKPDVLASFSSSSSLQQEGKCNGSMSPTQPLEESAVERGVIECAAKVNHLTYYERSKRGLQIFPDKLMAIMTQVMDSIQAMNYDQDAYDDDEEDEGYEDDGASFENRSGLSKNLGNMSAAAAIGREDDLNYRRRLLFEDAMLTFAAIGDARIMLDIFAAFFGQLEAMVQLWEESSAVRNNDSDSCNRAASSTSSSTSCSSSNERRHMSEVLHVVLHSESGRDIQQYIAATSAPDLDLSQLDDGLQ